MQVITFLVFFFLLKFNVYCLFALVFWLKTMFILKFENVNLFKLVMFMIKCVFINRLEES